MVRTYVPNFLNQYMPPGDATGAFFFFGFSVIMLSVIMRSDDTETAFWSANRVTFPALIYQNTKDIVFPQNKVFHPVNLNFVSSVFPEKIFIIFLIGHGIQLS